MSGHCSEISFVPPFLPDQTLYSWNSMFHVLSGAVSEAETRKTLYGSVGAGRHFHIPSHLDALCARTEGALGDPERILQTATTVPFYTQFKSPSTSLEILSKLRSPQCAGTAQTLGIANSGYYALPPRRGCVDCVREDKAEHGFSYWHRAHQLPGVQVCHKHHTPLFCIPLEPRHRRRARFSLPEVELARGAQIAFLNPDPRARHHLSRLAVVAMDMANYRSSTGWDRDQLRLVFQRAVQERKVLSTSGILDPLLLEMDYRQHFASVSYISEFSVAINQRGIYAAWCLLEGVVRPTHPLEWVLNIEWLFGTWTNFVVRYAGQYIH